MSKIVYLSPSTQQDNIGVAGYGTEESRMNQLCDKVVECIVKGRGDIKVYRNNPSMTLAQVVNDSNAKNPDIHFALHTNAVGGKGTEIYYHHNSTNGKKLATVIYNLVAPLTASPDRGVKDDYTLFTNGLYELRKTVAVASLIEIVFHDNLIDVNDYLNKTDVIAKAIARGIYQYFGMEYKEEYASSATEREQAIKKISQVSKWAEDYIREFDAIQAKGINVWGLINKFKV